MIDATTVRASDAFLAPGKAQDPAFGYGYLLWLLASGKRQCALFGNYDQRICVDPASKLIMVHTSVKGKPRSGGFGQLWSSNSGAREWARSVAERRFVSDTRRSEKEGARQWTSQ